MKFHIEIIVDISLNKLIELFENPENLKKWQPNLLKFEHLSGDLGQVGAKSRINYNMGIKKIIMNETVLKRNLPDEFVLMYESDGVTNTVTNNFKEIAPNKTRWIMQNNFKFGGLMKFAALAMKGVFKKQTELTMNRFKAFAESIPE
ncbi:MAG: SRPBCC family protein [Saprospiraceae bacterium]|nr:SRPBCC family protein [Saprospiraceae bacterium]